MLLVLVEEMVTDGIVFEIEIIWTIFPPVSLAVNLTLQRHDARYVAILNVEVTCRETDKIHEAPVRVLTEGTHLPRGSISVLGVRSVDLICDMGSCVRIGRLTTCNWTWRMRASARPHGKSS